LIGIHDEQDQEAVEVLISHNTTRLLQEDIVEEHLLQRKDQTSRSINAKNIATTSTRVETSRDIGGSHTEEDTADAASLLIT